MTIRSYRPDDPELAAFIGARVGSPAATDSGTPRLSNFDPRFGQYIAGELDKPTEKIMAEQKRATKDEVIDLPDGRQIQIQAEGAPVNDKLVKRERELVKASIEREEDADPLREIQPDTETRAIGARTLAESKTADPKPADKGK